MNDNMNTEATARGTARVEALADQIRQRILSGDFAPGQRLVEIDLSEDFSAPRRAVREALATLSYEGLVEIVANRGARVRIVDAEEALHLAEARFALEALCLERAAERAKPTDIAELRRIGNEMSNAAAANDAHAFARLTGELRSAYVALADQPVATELLQGLRDRNARFSRRLTELPGWPATALPHRIAIIDALAAGDGASARAALRKHFECWIEATSQLENQSR
ncbi:MAG: GntR family transcriptional regulator [Hyphomicrobiaceae bacterium]